MSATLVTAPDSTAKGIAKSPASKSSLPDAAAKSSKEIAEICTTYLKRGATSKLPAPSPALPAKRAMFTPSSVMTLIFSSGSMTQDKTAVIF